MRSSTPYRAASAWIRRAFDEVAYESEIERADASDPRLFTVTYADHIRSGERWHTHRCRQNCEVGSQSGEIVTITHRNIDGETERLDAFFAACGVTRPARDQVQTATAA